MFCIHISFLFSKGYLDVVHLFECRMGPTLEQGTRKPFRRPSRNWLRSVTQPKLLFQPRKATRVGKSSYIDTTARRFLNGRLSPTNNISAFAEITALLTTRIWLPAIPNYYASFPDMQNSKLNQFFSKPTSARNFQTRKHFLTISPVGRDQIRFGKKEVKKKKMCTVPRINGCCCQKDRSILVQAFLFKLSLQYPLYSSDIGRPKWENR